MGKVKKLIGVNEDIQCKTVIIIEDIVDTGITAENIINQIKSFKPVEIKIASLFFKPETFTKDFEIDYLGMKIPDYFIVGYGLDYKGIGRNLSDIYKLTD
jgi:hypoxanthine phosphoribosyltransferase